jgi:hypothetical protein
MAPRAHIPAQCNIDAMAIIKTKAAIILESAMKTACAFPPYQGHAPRAIYSGRNRF